MVHQLWHAYGDIEQYTHQLHQEIREKEDLTTQIREAYECLRTSIRTSHPQRPWTPRRNAVCRTSPERSSPDSFNQSACKHREGMTSNSDSKLLQQQQQRRQPMSQYPELRTPRERLFQERTPRARRYSLGSLSRSLRTEDEFWPHSRDTEKRSDQGIAHAMFQTALTVFTSKEEEASLFVSKMGEGAHRMYQLARDNFWNQTSKDGILLNDGLLEGSPNKCQDPNAFTRWAAQHRGRKVGDPCHYMFDVD